MEEREGKKGTLRSYATPEYQIAIVGRVPFQLLVIAIINFVYTISQLVQPWCRDAIIRFYVQVSSSDYEWKHKAVVCLCSLRVISLSNDDMMGIIRKHERGSACKKPEFESG